MSVMAAEIRAIPTALTRLASEGRAEIDAVAERAKGRYRRVVFVGRGTSAHAGVYGRYLFETQLGIPSAMAPPSVTTVYGAQVDWSDALFIGVSQSGRSPDLVTVMETARREGAVTVAITNDVASPLALAAETAIDCRAGEESSVPATKSYVAELATLATLVAELAGDGSLHEELEELPATVAGWLESADMPCGLLPALMGASGTLVLGRGFNLATAREIALKLTETCRLLAIGYSTADFEHGPVAVADPTIPAIALVPDGPARPVVCNVVDRLRTAGSPVWTIGHHLDADIAVPPVPDRVSPLVMVMPGLILAEQAARLRGMDPDNPPGLQKVTETR